MRRATTVIVAGLLLASLAGCSSAAPESVTTTHSAAPSHTTTHPAFVSQLDSIGGGTGGANAVLANGKTLYTSDRVDPVTITPVVGAGQTADLEASGVQMLPGSPVMVGLGVSINTLQNGLTAATSALAIQTFDARGDLVKNVPIPASVLSNIASLSGDGDAPMGVANLEIAGGTVVFAMNEGLAGLLVGMDVKTGSVLWTSPVPDGQSNCDGVGGTVSGFVGQSGVTTSGLYVYTTEDTVFALNIQTGATAWKNPLGPSCNYYLDSTNGPLESYVVIRSNGGPTWVLSTASGSTVAGDAATAVIDPVTQDVAVSFEFSSDGDPTVSPGDPALKVIGANGSTIFSLPAAQGVALGGLSVQNAFDGRLWVDTPAGLEIIDAENGKLDPLSATLISEMKAAGTTSTSGTASWTMLGARLLRHPGAQISISALQSALGQIAQQGK